MLDESGPALQLDLRQGHLLRLQTIACHQLTLRQAALIEFLRLQGFEIGQRARRQAADNTRINAINTAVAVTERAGVDGGNGVELTSVRFILGGRFLAHAQRNADLVPKQLQCHANGGDPAQDDLQQHAAGARVKIGKGRLARCSTAGREQSSTRISSKKYLLRLLRSHVQNGNGKHQNGAIILQFCQTGLRCHGTSPPPRRPRLA